MKKNGGSLFFMSHNLFFLSKSYELAMEADLAGRLVSEPCLTMLKRLGLEMS